MRIPATLGLAVTLLCACSSGPVRIPENLPRLNAATVRAWSPGDVRVEAVDGVEIGKVSHVLVGPGEHQFTVRWSGGQGVTRLGQVREVVQGGNTYVIEADEDSMVPGFAFGS